MAVPINTPFVGIQTASLQTVLALVAGSGLTITPNIPAQTLTLSASLGSISGSGAAGQITFWTGASVLSGDNGLGWDNTNKRLGIGTLTPQTKHQQVGGVFSILTDGVSPPLSAGPAGIELSYRTDSSLDEALFSVVDRTSGSLFKPLLISASLVTIGQGGLQLATATSLPAGGAAFIKHASDGLLIAAATGSVFDFALMNPSGASGIFFTPTGTVNMGMNGILYLYKGVATAGNVGVAVCYGAAVLTGQTGNATVCSYTPASDGTFFVNANARLISGSISANVVVDWTDAYTGTVNTNGLFVTSGGASAFGGSVSIRAKGGTTITIHTITSNAGTYDVDAQIVQYA